jgi:hypothetical protein
MHEPYFATDEIGAIFSDRATLQHILEFAPVRAETAAALPATSS